VHQNTISNWYFSHETCAWSRKGIFTYPPPQSICLLWYTIPHLPSFQCSL
jgi:hypothetical protein